MKFKAKAIKITMPDHLWHSWFAWFPITTVNREVIWLESIQRRFVLTTKIDHFGEPYEAHEWQYQLPSPSVP